MHFVGPDQLHGFGARKPPDELVRGVTPQVRA
jgi:hypothetical protein